MTERKLCRDCRWAANPAAELAEARPYDWICNHSGARLRGQPDYVTGRPVQPQQDKCLFVRDDDHRCGPEGRWWEAQEVGFG